MGVQETAVNRKLPHALVLLGAFALFMGPRVARADKTSTASEWRAGVGSHSMRERRKPTLQENLYHGVPLIGSIISLLLP